MQLHAVSRYSYIYDELYYVKVKFSRYRPGVAQRVGRAIALLFHDRGTRRGEWSAARPGRTLPPGKSRYTFYRRLGGPQGWSGRAKNLIPTGIRSRTVQPVFSRLDTVWCTFQRQFFSKWTIATKETQHFADNKFLVISTSTSFDHISRHQENADCRLQQADKYELFCVHRARDPGKDRSGSSTSRYCHKFCYLPHIGCVLTVLFNELL